MKLTKATDVDIVLQTQVGYEPLWFKTIACKKEDEIELETASLVSGLYIIYLTTSSSVRVLKLTVVK
jgi:hypothetical protein